MSNSKGSTSGMDVILGLDNWSTFDMAFKDYAIGFGDAGIMLTTGVVPLMVEPDFNAVDVAGARLYDDKAAYGRSMWIDDRRSIHKRKERFVITLHFERLAGSSPKSIGTNLLGNLSSC